MQTAKKNLPFIKYLIKGFRGLGVEGPQHSYNTLDTPPVDRANKAPNQFLMSALNSDLKSKVTMLSMDLIKSTVSSGLTSDISKTVLYLYLRRGGLVRSLRAHNSFAAGSSSDY